MRKVIVIILVLFLSACSSFNAEKTRKGLINAFAGSLEESEFKSNNSLRYISYYKPSDMQEIDYDDSTIVFQYNHSRMVANINVAAIVNHHYYNNDYLIDEGFFEPSKLFYEFNGSYMDGANISRLFFFKAYELEDCFMLQFTSSVLNIYAYSPKEDVVATTKHMLVIAKGAVVNEDEIASYYSPNQAIEYERTQLDLFDFVVNGDGYLIDLVDPSERPIEESVVE